MRRFCRIFSIVFVALALFLGTVFGVEKIMSVSAASPTYTITFHGGAGDPEVLQTGEDGKLTKLPTTPTSDNSLAKFAGWFSQEEPKALDAQTIDADTVFKANADFYAKWVYELEVSTTESGYSLSFNEESKNFNNFADLITTAATLTTLQEQDTLPLRFTLPDTLTFSSETLLDFETQGGALNEFDVFEFFPKSSATAITLSEGCLKLKTASDQTINLNGISVTANGGGNLLELEGDGAVNLKSMSFTGGEYAVFNGDGASISFSDDTECKSTYFSNYKSGKPLSLFGDPGNLSQLKVVVPYTVYNSLIVNNVPFMNSESEKIVLVPESDNFRLYCYTSGSTKSLVASSVIDITLSGGGGYFEGEQETLKNSITYGESGDKDLSTQTPSKESAEFIGFVGKLELEEKCYYFDRDLLETFVASGEYDYENIETLFAKSPEALNATRESCFTKYCFSSSPTDLDFAVLEIFMRAGAKPCFEAVYEYPAYAVNFVTGTEDSIAPTELRSGENLKSFIDTYLSDKSLSREGYSLEGWYLDSELQEGLTAEYTMPNESVTLYAKWQIKTFTVKYYSDAGTEYTTKSVNYGDEIDLTDPVSDGTVPQGYEFGGWYLDADHTKPLPLENFTTMPDISTMPEIDGYELKLYAKLDARTYTIILNFGNIEREPLTLPAFNFNTTIPTVDDSFTEVTGHRFLGWFVNTDYNVGQIFNFFGSQMSSEFKDIGLIWSAVDGQRGHYTTTLYGYFERKIYKVSFVSNVEGLELQDMLVHYRDAIIIPPEFKYAGYKLVGWYSDSEFNFAFDLSAMPDLDGSAITLYAKWEQKKTVGGVNRDVQTYSISSFSGYNVGGELSDFVVSYSSDGVSWTSDIPRAVGTYDVRISRAEDADYAAFELIIPSALVLKNPQINLNWLIALLFVLFLIEVVGCVVIRIIRNAKKNMVAYSLVPLFSYVIDSSQFILLIISSILVVFGLALVIYELVKLHNTLPSYDDTPAKQNKYSQNAHGIEYENDSEPEALKYSAEDVKNLLTEDSYTKQHHSKSAKKKEDKYIDPITKTKLYKQRLESQSEQRDLAGPEQKIYGRKTGKVPKQNIEFSDSEELYNLDDSSAKKVKVKDIDEK